MKIDLAREFFNTHVIPNHDEWVAQPTDIRLAMNAVLSMYHLADHFWHQYKDTAPGRVFETVGTGIFRSTLSARCENFSILRDVAEAHKHMKLDRRPGPVQTALCETSFGDAGWGEGPYGGSAAIVVSLDDNSKRHLITVLMEVKNMWIEMLGRYESDF